MFGYYNSPAYSSQSAGVFFEMIQIVSRSVCLINGQTFYPRMFTKSSDILPQTLFDMWEAPELAHEENWEFFLFKHPNFAGLSDSVLNLSLKNYLNLNLYILRIS